MRKVVTRTGAPENIIVIGPQAEGSQFAPSKAHPLLQRGEGRFATALRRVQPVRRRSVGAIPVTVHIWIATMTASAASE